MEVLGCGFIVIIYLIVVISGDMGLFSYNWEGLEGYFFFELIFEVILLGLYSMMFMDVVGVIVVVVI